MIKNYRISFDYAAETPRQAVSFLQGVIEDPGLQDHQFTWIVTDLATGDEHTVKASCNELEREAQQQVTEFVDGLR